MKSMSIKEIASALSMVEDEADKFLMDCRNDDRKGVQKLVAQWQKANEQRKKAERDFHELLRYERGLWERGFDLIAGIDEVGRGPLAGPVVAAAVVLPKDFRLIGINDSKKLSETKRELFYEEIYKGAIHVGVGILAAEEIDALNIYQATKKAMLSALKGLGAMPDYLLIDAMELPAPMPQSSIIKGDAASASIAAASIIAKVTRDRMMKEYHQKYPQYGFAQNMGYGTKEHLDALHKWGPTPIHRKTFAPVKNL
ncbi:ribonuclease HII [Falsibacillus albus]|uniref:Ribonuclease HII n=1 Tax=Falsibacillus albus TaxID=2478915 RepID=A0A3L7K4X8_9BACI|nr:ribonuclease HII [Falsibacillus albus]RLQ95762.1 ribonuclease HII [Falsibacillus albus]